ncbi:aminomethyltransferase, putative [Babesia ovata]|uniref:Aminomethyltransferase, putative n=1 Tax=Babesia ovata TaxID=189622 RepID=A0A2H6KEG6_9APIC|nr:aminomethyltransferase, putative [Babesia ovata]GBE61374.1 aminomethyltransferase, putative [Babesia ovata]
MILGRLGGRAIFSFWGTDSFTFLQGLTTNDISLLDNAKKRLIGCVFLGSDGRIQADGLVHRRENGYMVEIGTGNLEAFTKLVRRRKLAAKVEYRLEQESIVYGYTPRKIVRRVSPTEPEATQPTDASLHVTQYTADLHLLNRKYAFNEPISEAPDLTMPHRLHLALNGFGLTLVKDLSSLKILPQDLALHKMGFIAKNKGCYVGQEIMNRILNKTLMHKYQLHFLLRRDHIDAPLDESSSESFCTDATFYRTLDRHFGGPKAASILHRVVNQETTEQPMATTDAKIIPLVYYSTGFGLGLIPQRSMSKNNFIINELEHISLSVLPSTSHKQL